MLLHTASHLYAETIAEGKFRTEWDELRQAFGTMDPPLRPAGPFTPGGRPPTPKRQRRRINGRDAYCMFPIDQVALNHEIDKRLRAIGWGPQPVAKGDLVTDAARLGLKGDFAKNGIFVEVEFGNVASIYRDLFKFQVAGRAGVGRLGVLVVFAERASRFVDQGVATWEHCSRMLPYMDIGIQLPVVIVGLDLNDWSAVRRRYDEMVAEAEANRVACHSFDAVYGADQIAMEP